MDNYPPLTLTNREMDSLENAFLDETDPMIIEETNLRSILPEKEEIPLFGKDGSLIITGKSSLDKV